MTIEFLRRFLVVQSLLLWQGGFVFYAAVVVPVGATVLGSDREQGFITQQVTIWLNRFGGICLLLMLLDALVLPPWRRGRIAGVLACGGLLAMMVFWLHGVLDAGLDVEDRRVRDRRAFYYWHAVYLWCSVAHWVLMLVLTGLTLAAWRQHDSQAHLESRSNPLNPAAPP